MQTSRPHHLEPTKQTARIAFVTKNFGERLGLSNVGLGVINANTAKVLRRHGYYAESWSVQTAAALEAHIEEVNATAHRLGQVLLTDIVITSPSWASINAIADLCFRHPDIRFTLVNHTGSSYMQIDRNEDHTGVETNKLAAKLELERHNFRLAANNTRYVEMMERTHRTPTVYLPNLYDTDTLAGRTKPRTPHDTIHIGGFGAPRPWKNQLTGAQAAIAIARDLGKRLKFYFNHGDWTDEQLANSRASLFSGERDLEMIEVPWESWATFRRTIATMDLLVHPSFDETFCIIVADGLAEGVPSVASPSIEWCPRRWQADPFDAPDCCRAGIYLLNDPYAVADGRKALINYVSAALERWKDYLGR